jgi:hypothetical protein
MPPGPSNIFMPLAVPRIYRMPWVDWPAVGADLRRVAARFLTFLRALVVQLTKRLKLAEKEFLLITFMWLDVIAIVTALMRPSFKHISHSGCERS